MNQKCNYNILSTLIIASTLFACKNDDLETIITPAVDPTYAVTLNMETAVNGVALQTNTTDFRYTNGMSQTYNVTKLQYLISNVTFNKADGSKFTIDEYHYVDLTVPSTLIFNPTIKVPKGNYTSVEFTFGFDETNNISGAYSDLNTIGWNWPNDPNSMFGNLGGGYHFMRLEGTFVNGTDTAQFKSHMGTARDISSMPFTYVANHFQTNPSVFDLNVSTNFSLDVVMNIEEWYINPQTWDFTVWNLPIMPLFDAQRALNANGRDVFVIKPS